MDSRRTHVHSRWFEWTFSEGERHPIERNQLPLSSSKSPSALVQRTSEATFSSHSSRASNARPNLQKCHAAALSGLSGSRYSQLVFCASLPSDHTTCTFPASFFLILFLLLLRLTHVVFPSFPSCYTRFTSRPPSFQPRASSHPTASSTCRSSPNNPRLPTCIPRSPAQHRSSRPKTRRPLLHLHADETH